MEPPQEDATAQAVMDLSDRLDSLEACLSEQFDKLRAAFVLGKDTPGTKFIHDHPKYRLETFLGYSPTPEQQIAFFDAFAQWQAARPERPLVTNREADFKSKEGNRVRYTYADLAAVIAVAQTAAPHGLAAFTCQEFDSEGRAVVTAYLVHKAGGCITSGPVPLFTTQSTRPGQEHGKALTTCRRLALQIVLGLAADRDDDFNGSDETYPAGRSTPQGQTTATPLRRPSRPEQTPHGQTRSGPPPGWLSREERQRLEEEIKDPALTPARFEEIEQRLNAARGSSVSNSAKVTG